jgi:hypothetical protein
VGAFGVLIMTERTRPPRLVGKFLGGCYLTYALGILGVAVTKVIVITKVVV